MVGLLDLWTDLRSAINMVKTRGAFGKPKWSRAKKVKIEPIVEKKEIPPEKPSWWSRAGRYIWGRT